MIKNHFLTVQKSIVLIVHKNTFYKWGMDRTKMKLNRTYLKFGDLKSEYCFNGYMESIALRININTLKELISAKVLPGVK